MQSLIEFKTRKTGQVPGQDHSPYFYYATENGGFVYADECEHPSDHHIVCFCHSRLHAPIMYIGYKTIEAANEAAKAMVPRLPKNEAKEKGAIAPVTAFAKAPFASEGNPQLAVAG